MYNLWFAFGLTLLAGMATGVGSMVAFFAKRTDYRFLSIATGFSAGVMLYVSFVEIFLKGDSALSESFGAQWGPWVNVASFFGGILLIAVIDNLIPAAENPHEIHSEDETAPLHNPSAPLPDFSDIQQEGHSIHGQDMHDHHVRKGKLLRMGLFTALAITIHNFPEGLATFLAALQDPAVGIAIAFAIALHNIPEGISVSVPIFYATGDRRKAFILSLLSGMSEFVGALIAYLVLITFFGMGNFPSHIMGILFAGVAGIMVYISLDELLPTSRAYGKGHDSIIGLISGMLVMALSLLMLK